MLGLCLDAVGSLFHHKNHEAGTFCLSRTGGVLCVAHTKSLCQCTNILPYSLSRRRSFLGGRHIVKNNFARRRRVANRGGAGEFLSCPNVIPCSLFSNLQVGLVAQCRRESDWFGSPVRCKRGICSRGIADSY